ncbi:MAG: hypothetical protein H7A30_06555 [Thermotogae bacterium]|nr:hypothetical protein [Thermotogota bacterium]
MNSFEYIKFKQKVWAANNNLSLFGSNINSAENIYLDERKYNLFEDLYDETIAELSNGDGSELISVNGLPKINALHSSSSLAINIFQYWRKKEFYNMLKSLNYFLFDNLEPKDIKFEQKFPVFKNVFPPNIDVTIYTELKEEEKIIAIESKFTEPYRKHEQKLNESYIKKYNFWKELPSLFNLSNDINSGNLRFRYLDPVQLIRHILGLKSNYKKENFILLYIFYDVFGEDSKVHHEEIKKFKDICTKDGIYFHYISYQEFIFNLNNNLSYKDHKEYLDYINLRYL